MIRNRAPRLCCGSVTAFPAAAAAAEMGEMAPILIYEQLMMNYWAVLQRHKMIIQLLRPLGHAGEVGMQREDVKWQKKQDYMRRDSAPRNFTQRPRRGPKKQK